jgi:hypothetical protein
MMAQMPTVGWLFASNVAKGGIRDNAASAGFIFNLKRFPQHC